MSGSLIPLTNEWWDDWPSLSAYLVLGCSLRRRVGKLLQYNEWEIKFVLPSLYKIFSL
jgi:hypothetical protein